MSRSFKEGAIAFRELCDLFENLKPALTLGATWPDDVARGLYKIMFEPIRGESTAEGSTGRRSSAHDIARRFRSASIANYTLECLLEQISQLVDGCAEGGRLWEEFADCPKWPRLNRRWPTPECPRDDMALLWAEGLEAINAETGTVAVGNSKFASLFTASNMLREADMDQRDYVHRVLAQLAELAEHSCQGCTYLAGLLERAKEPYVPSFLASLAITENAIEDMLLAIAEGKKDNVDAYAVWRSLSLLFFQNRRIIDPEESYGVAKLGGQCHS